MNKDLRDLYIEESLRTLRLKRSLRRASKALTAERSLRESDRNYAARLQREVDALRVLPATIEAEGNATAAANASVLLTGLRTLNVESIPRAEVISFLETILGEQS